jgi:hypothetical protein
VAHRQLVVAGGHATMLFEQVDAALHGVALLLCALVEHRRPTALGPQPEPVASLVLLGRDDTPDPASTRPRPVGLRAVRLIGQHPVGSGPRSSDMKTGGPGCVHGYEDTELPDEAMMVKRLVVGQRPSRHGRNPRVIRRACQRTLRTHRGTGPAEGQSNHQGSGKPSLLLEYHRLHAGQEVGGCPG